MSLDPELDRLYIDFCQSTPRHETRYNERDCFQYEWNGKKELLTMRGFFHPAKVGWWDYLANNLVVYKYHIYVHSNIRAAEGIAAAGMRMFTERKLRELTLAVEKLVSQSETLGMFIARVGSEPEAPLIHRRMEVWMRKWVNGVPDGKPFLLFKLREKKAVLRDAK